jgi:hypothetical protein
VLDRRLVAGSFESCLSIAALPCARLTDLVGGQVSSWRTPAAGEWIEPVAQSENDLRLQRVDMKSFS